MAHIKLQQSVSNEASCQMFGSDVHVSTDVHLTIKAPSFLAKVPYKNEQSCVVGREELKSGDWLLQLGKFEEVFVGIAQEAQIEDNSLVAQCRMLRWRTTTTVHSIQDVS